MVEIKLTRGMVAIVDDADAGAVQGISWNASWCPKRRSFYATSVIGAMHRLIMRAPSGMVVDHANHDTLDNRRSNLRICSPRQNSWNRRKSPKNNTSGFKGVVWDKTRRVWLAQIRVDYRLKNLGRYHSALDAAKAYDIAAEEARGEFALLNFPKGI